MVKKGNMGSDKPKEIIPPFTFPSRWRSCLPLCTTAVFFAVLVINLCFPTPLGPADSGDEIRNYAFFSTGPQGLASWEAEGSPLRKYRFFNYYLRFWRIGRGSEAVFARPSSTRFLFSPALYLRLNTPPGLYDLTLNTFYLVFLLSVGMYCFLRFRSPPGTFFSSIFILLVLTDSGVAAFMNSLYQEAGTYFFLVPFLFALCALQRRKRIPELTAVVVFGFLWMATKQAYIPSLGLILGFLLFRWAGRRSSLRLRLLRSILVLVLVCAGGWGISSWMNVADNSPLYCYNVVFTRILPALPEGERPSFLKSIGAPAEFAAASGTFVFVLGNSLQDPKLRPLLTGRLQVRAILQLFQRHPLAGLRLIYGVGHLVGNYEFSLLGYRESKYSSEKQGVGSVSLWTKFRKYYFHGWFSSGICFLLCLGLFLLKPLENDGGWFTFYRWGSLAFLLGSLSQIPIVTFGDGNPMPTKQLYLANLLQDVVLIFVVSAICLYLKMRSRSAGYRESGLASSQPSV
jgi:hypothetical protein